MASIKNMLKKIAYGAKYDSSSYVQYLKSKGVRIGERTIIYSPTKVMIDETRPFLIEIGDDVQITEGVTILTHGYDWSVLKKKYGTVLGSSGKVKIGNNCFIGVNTTILKGVTIGDNCIIGANSLLTSGAYPDDSVIAGSPAKVIGNIEDYYKKRLVAQKMEAKELAVEYKKTHGINAPKELFYEFFWLFEPRESELIPEFNKMMNLVGNYDMSREVFKQTKPEFSSYDEFITWCYQSK